jgi:hypothetical protein
MKPNIRIALWTFSVFLLVSTFSFVLIEEAKDVIKKADEKMRGKTSQSEMTIQIIRPTWTREMKMKAWTKETRFAMILITSPAKEKGTVFLKDNKEVWN